MVTIRLGGAGAVTAGEAMAGAAVVTTCPFARRTEGFALFEKVIAGNGLPPTVRFIRPAARSAAEGPAIGADGDAPMTESRLAMIESSMTARPTNWMCCAIVGPVGLKLFVVTIS